MRLRTGLGIASVAAAATAVACAAWLLRDPRPWFDRRYSAIASVQEQPPAEAGKSRVQSVRITASSGLRVDVTWKRSVSDSARRVPAAIILGGYQTGARAALAVGETPGVMVAAISYPYAGDLRPSTATFLRQIPLIRQAFLDTPPALALVHDWLRARPDVDTTRVELIGVSLGTPFVTIAAARDPRIARVWVMHGSGGTYGPLEMNMRRTIRSAPLRLVAAAIANLIIAGPRLAAERWVAGIAPRPFIMINASDDERLPRAGIQTLYDAAAQPKEMIWMSGSHIHGDAETIERLVRIVLPRLQSTARTPR